MSTSSSGVGESSLYIGLNLQNILYGVELCLYFKTICVTLARRGATLGANVFYQAFSSVMLLLVTIWVATGSIFGQEVWLLNQNYPGGPAAYEDAHVADLYIVVAGAGTFILQLMTDCLMVYRCRIVWDSRRAIIIPSILWLATLGLGILVMWKSTMPQTFTFNGSAAQLGLAYYTTSVLLHVTLTGTICCRFVCHARKMKELGEEYASPYFSMIKLFVESALPYTVTGIALLISFGVGSQMEIALSRVYPLMTCISPQLLILRVAEGSAWQKDTMKLPVSVVVFSPDRGDTSSSGRFDGREAVTQFGPHVPSGVVLG